MMKMSSKSLIIQILISLIVIIDNRIIQASFGSAVFESEEFTLAIVNVTGVGAFTGLASNLYEEIPAHSYGRVTTLTGILIRSQSPAHGDQPRDTYHQMEPEQLAAMSDFKRSESVEGKYPFLESKDLVIKSAELEVSRFQFQEKVRRLAEPQLAGWKSASKPNSAVETKPNETNSAVETKRNSAEDSETRDDPKSESGEVSSDPDDVPDDVPDDACSPIKLSWIPRQRWILLVKYGNCPDEEKMRHISAVNASAVLIYDNLPGHRLVKFTPSSKHSHLHSLVYGISLEVGLFILSRTFGFILS